MELLTFAQLQIVLRNPSASYILLLNSKKSKELWKSEHHKTKLEQYMYYDGLNCGE
ncbi:hypothetical protein A0J61_11957, partial [Choanephora cucurbitarum]